RDLLDLLDAIDIEGRAGAQVAGGVLRNDAGLRHRISGRQPDVEPGFVAALIAPDRAHVRMRVPTDHSLVRKIASKRAPDNSQPPTPNSQRTPIDRLRVPWELG